LEEHRAMEEELGAELEEVRTELEAKERALKEARKLASNQEQELLEREFKAAEKAAELAGQVREHSGSNIQGTFRERLGDMACVDVLF
jgi:uncharacterized Zn finger protein